MKKKNRRLCFSLCALAIFIFWTVVVRYVDVDTIGPQGSRVGFATLNASFYALTGVHMSLYTITDWLGLVPVAVAFGYAVTGLVQLLRRKSLFRVDSNILALGVFYLVVMCIFVFFEAVVINYRPVLISGVLEASYPSSTTMLVMCVMPTAAMLLRSYIKNNVFRQCVVLGMDLFVAFMVIGRLLAGVHWVTDIVGGALLSTGLVRMYRFVCALEEK